MPIASLQLIPLIIAVHLTFWVVKMKKALEAPSNIMILIIFLVVLTIVILLALLFGQSIKDSASFQKVTNFSKVLRWG
jgi:hypothetical protein